MAEGKEAEDRSVVRMNDKVDTQMTEAGTR